MANFIVAHVPEIERGVYLIACTTMPGVYKIGMSTDAKRRLLDFRRKYPAHRFKLLHFFRCERTGIIERAIHRFYEHRRINGEWFYLTDEDVTEYMTTSIGRFLYGRYPHRMNDTLRHVQLRLLVGTARNDGAAR